MAWPATVPTFATGVGGISVTKMNQLRDALNVVGTAWTAYTPTWAASTTSPTLGATSIAGRYRLAGKTADIHITIVVGAGFAAGSGGYTLTLPSGVSPLLTSASEAMGYANLRDVSVPTSRGYHAYFVTTTTIALFKPDDGAIWGAASPWVPATGDVVSIHIPALELA